MQRYTLKGFTGPYPDFTDEIELPDNFDFEAAMASTDVRYNAAWNVLKRALSDSACDCDYLETLDAACFEVRDDLADNDVPGQVVLCGETLGCDNCQEGHGSNEWTDGCDDVPHGGMLLTFDPVADADNCDACGEGLDLDGFDGKCGNCADAAWIDCDQAKLA